MKRPTISATFPKGVIFDIDGTLVDSNDVHALCWCEAFDRRGFQPGFDAVRKLIGMGGDKLIPIVTGLDKNDPKAKALSELRSHLFLEKYLSRVKPLPKTRELYERVLEAGLRATIASSANEEELCRLIEVAGIADLVENETSKDDAGRSKPDPDAVKAALGKLKLAPEEAFLIGDTPYDIEAAAQSEVWTLAFRSGGWSDCDLAAAAAIYDGPWDLLEHYDESPLAGPDALAKRTA